MTQKCNPTIASVEMYPKRIDFSLNLNDSLSKFSTVNENDASQYLSEQTLHEIQTLRATHHLSSSLLVNTF